MAIAVPKLKFAPPQILAIGYAAMVLIGTLLLMLPVSNTTGRPLPLIDAFFTATSAVCVTGLVVVDTGSFFSGFGQSIILVLIQIGGLGFMTLATLLALVLQRRLSLRDRLLLQEAMNQGSMEGIVRLIRRVLYYSLAIEAAGALLFASRMAFDMPLGRALYFGLFHSISFFNNAGFDLFGQFLGMAAYVDDPVMNLTAVGLIILGGLGFVVLSDLADFRRKKQLSLHSKVVLSTTGILIAIGFAVFLMFEWGNPGTIGRLGLGGKFWGSLLQAVAPRTAGINSVDLTTLHQATQFLLLILMFIGASPGSTGGGVKTTTFAVTIGAMVAMMRGRDDVVFFRKRLARERIIKALTIILLSLAYVIGVAMMLSATEDRDFMIILFETMSAFGTVGMTLGLTPDLSTFGKVVIALSMFAGRVGLLTLVYALKPKKTPEKYRYPEGKIIIG
ncbi:TrkH family potassium uptake protein [Saccharibacillus sp. CPCC 101409]|uniref:TrkH family potassium uptake protein n=1 Tax=Saccharibacillus sp. CPCC 101409 TaxID=3058041 RepID=UPI0026720269|nr:TrkH family potassium uptake protein [Saccharibacillus sp. CPCC 101409]MDO3411043.1 TrkH family potassium uptake protein [Saccharibacillus sp. CPCC 101409]